MGILKSLSLRLEVITTIEICWLHPKPDEYHNLYKTGLYISRVAYGVITEAVKIAAFVSAWNIICVPHSFSSAIALVSNLHFSASIPNGRLQEFDSNHNPLREELLPEPIKINKEGSIYLLQAPGLGVELNESVVKKYRVD